MTAQSGSDERDSLPSFRSLIDRSGYLRREIRGDHGEGREPSGASSDSSTGPAAQASRGDRALSAALDEAEEGNFDAAQRQLEALVERSPRSARFRYYLARLHYRRGLAVREADRAAHMRRARDEIYRTFDLLVDPSDPQNAVYARQAEVLFDRINGNRQRKVLPVHGQIESSYDPENGRRGMTIGNVVGRNGRTIYRVEFKPVASFGPGTILAAGLDLQKGKTLEVLYHDARGKSFTVVYGHLRDFNGLRSGMKVQKDTILGHVGRRPGAQEPSLYIEFRRRGRTYDPAPILGIDDSSPF